MYWRDLIMRKESQERKPVRTDRFINTYAEIPQPEGKFRSLFQEMREKSEAKNNGRSSKNDDSAK